MAAHGATTALSWGVTGTQPVVKLHHFISGRKKAHHPLSGGLFPLYQIPPPPTLKKKSRNIGGKKVPR